MELPLEILDIIAGDSEPVFRSMLVIPRFARSLSIGRRFNFRIHFGYDCRIEKNQTLWLKMIDGVTMIHRIDAPAIEYTNGTKCWYQYGKLHRDGGPAVEYASETKRWYQRGKLHRVDGPAVEDSDGTKYWYRNNQLHRDDGPTIEYTTGTKCWYQRGKLHRNDNPAIERSDGSCEFWIHNVKQ